MRKNTFFKTIIFLFIGMSILSCSNEENIKEFESEEPIEINPMDAYIPLNTKPAKNKENFLGKGYDYTGMYSNDYSTKNAIIDLDKYLTDSPGAYDASFTTESSNYSIIAANANIYTKKLTNHSNDNYWNPIPDNMNAFSGFILDNSMIYNKNEKLEDFSFASTHFYFIKDRHKLNGRSIDLQKYLSTSFKTDLAALSAKELIEKYGTHIITSYNMGLRLDILYKSKINKSSYTSAEYDGQYYTEKYVEAGLRYTINKMGYWANGAINPPESKDVERNAVPVLYVENHGGDNNLIPSGIYNLQKGYPQINISKWFNSNTDENTALIDIDLDRLIPIYEIITDENKREEVKLSVEKHIELRQIRF